jgi:hypothetical protein
MRIKLLESIDSIPTVYSKDKSIFRRSTTNAQFLIATTPKRKTLMITKMNVIIRMYINTTICR